MNRLALFIVALSGFVSLSYEILWFRVYAFLTGGTAASFGVVLSAFLLGIAVGSFAARRFCQDASATGQADKVQGQSSSASSPQLTPLPVVAIGVAIAHCAKMVRASGLLEVEVSV